MPFFKWHFWSVCKFSNFQNKIKRAYILMKAHYNACMPCPNRFERVTDPQIFCHFPHVVSLSAGDQPPRPGVPLVDCSNCSMIKRASFIISTAHVGKFKYPFSYGQSLHGFTPMQLLRAAFTFSFSILCPFCRAWPPGWAFFYSIQAFTIL